MSDQTFRNVINGELVDSVSGETYDIVDPTTAPEARGMRVVKGDLADLDHGVAITSGFSFDSGVHLGDKLLGAPVVAVVRDAPDLYADVIAPKSRFSRPARWKLTHW